MAKMRDKQAKKALLVIRLRGGINTIPKIKETLRHLRLNQINHCVVIQDNSHTQGMLQVVKDYVTWGEVDEKTMVEVIMERGRRYGDHPVTDAYVKSVSDFGTVKEFAAAVVNGKFKYGDLKDIKPLFRLHPPVGGVGKTKRHFTVGGALGYRGGAINDFVSRMIKKPEPRRKKKEKKAVPSQPVKKKVLKKKKKKKRTKRKKEKVDKKKKVAKKVVKKEEE